MPNDSILQKTDNNYFAFSELEDFENYKETLHQEIDETLNCFIFRVVCKLIEKGENKVKQLKKEGCECIYEFSHETNVRLNAAIHLPEVNFTTLIPTSQSC